MAAVEALKAGAMMFPDADHDHRRCRETMLASAEQICADHGRRLTAQRRRVLEIISEQHGALGAYEIIDRLAADGARPAPIMVYRALDFLIGCGLVHRLASRNAYVPCARPSDPHPAEFLICDGCGRVAELAADRVNQAIAQDAAAADFQVAVPMVEITGVCAACREHERG